MVEVMRIFCKVKHEKTGTKACRDIRFARPGRFAGRTCQHEQYKQTIPEASPE